MVLLLAACVAPEPAEYALIPLPASVEEADGGFVLRPGARVAVSPGAEAVAELLAADLRTATGLPLEVTLADPRPQDLALVLAPGFPDEGYALDSTDGLVITASTAAGLFYGGQTLRQLLPPEGGDVVPSVRIEDAPRYAWRGVMLDVARHFFDVETVLRLIDLAALHKLNVLHLHLTDDQGWRIQIEGWPLLAEVGGSTQVGGGPGGFYTKDDYAEIVDYAAARFVTVVPEIDVPGHVNAALASYGELDPSGEAPPLYTGTGVGFSALDTEASAAFVRDVFGEVAAMTPGPWLHMGGDEAPEVPSEAYADFVRSVQEVIEGHGKTLVGWEEIGDAHLSPPFVAQGWTYRSELDRAVASGADVLASPAAYAYLDMKYDVETPIGTLWAGATDTEDAYDWDPDALSPSVVGVEAPLWTETVATPDEIDLLTWPRLCGHAEIGWSPPERDWATYRERLALHGQRLDALGVGFYRDPGVDWR